MENYQQNETEEWGMGNGGDEETNTDGEVWGERGEKFLHHPPTPPTPPTLPACPMPDAQSPIPKTQVLLYLIPIIGFFPSLWTLYRRRGSREQLAISRLSITLALTWLLGYSLLATGAATSDFFTIRLFILNSFLTSGYFLVSVWLILRVIQGKSRRLPGFTTLAERVVGKYLS